MKNDNNYEMFGAISRLFEKKNRKNMLIFFVQWKKPCFCFTKTRLHANFRLLTTILIF